MIRNIISTAVRYFVKHWGYSLINVFGLGLGLATCILIFLYVQDELSYDRFHTNADNIYRIEPHFVGQGSESHWAASTGNIIPFIQANYPEVVSSCKINFNFNQDIIIYGDKSFREEEIIWVDSTFLEVFSFEVINGRKEGALAGPSKVACWRMCNFMGI